MGVFRLTRMAAERIDLFDGVAGGCLFVRPRSEEERQRFLAMWQSDLWREVHQIYPGGRPSDLTFVLYPLRPEDV